MCLCVLLWVSGPLEPEGQTLEPSLQPLGELVFNLLTFTVT